MSSQDPLDIYTRRLRGELSEPSQDPLDRYVSRIQEGEGDGGVLRRVGEFFQTAGKVFEGGLWPTSVEGMALRARMAAGIVGTPIEALGAAVGLPGALFDRPIITDVAADFLKRSASGIYTFAESVALTAGATSDEIEDAHNLGNLVGMIAPIGASVKIASFVIGTRINLAKHVILGDLVTDAMAGLIYGGVFEEGEGKERINHALQESAIFGMTRILLQALTLPTIGYSLKRTREKAVNNEVLKKILDIESGRKVTIETTEEAIALGSLQTEQRFLMNSAVGQDLLARVQDELVTVQSIVDVAGARGTAGVVEGLEANFRAEMLPKLREQFPALKFEVVSREGTQSLYFGQRGLSNVQKAAFKQDGRFPGQTVWRDGAEYEFTKVATEKPGFIWVKRADGRSVRMKGDRVTNLPVVRERPTPEIDLLYNDFRTDVVRMTDEVADRAGGLAEHEVVRSIREGRFALNESDRRAFGAGGAIVYPEELGMLPLEQDVQRLVARMHQAAAQGEVQEFNRLQRMLLVSEQHSPEAVARLINETGFDHARVLSDTRTITYEEMFDRWAQQRGILPSLPSRPAGAGDYEAARAHFAARLRQEMWSQVDDETKVIYDSVMKEHFKLLEERDIPVQAYAHMKGFHYERNPDGTVRLRDINTGASVDFSGEQAVRAMLLKFATPESGWAAQLPLGGEGISSLTGGFWPTDGAFTFSDNILSREFLDDLPQTIFRNTRDLFQRIEELSGIPLFTKGFQPLDTGTSQMHNFMEPWGKQVEQTWKGIRKPRKEKIVEFWNSLQGEDVPIAEAIRRAKGAGLTEREIGAWKRARAIFDGLFPESGISGNRYVNYYYSRMRPVAAKNGGIPDPDAAFPEGIPMEFKWAAEMSRTGDLGVIELDPEIVMHKYLRGLAFNRFIRPHYDEIIKLTGSSSRPPLRVKDVPPAKRAAMEEAAGHRLDPEAPVLPEPILKLVQEYLTVIRGQPGAALATSRRFTTSFFKKLGVQADERLIEEYVNAMTATMYGAAMGLRPALVARNTTQLMWTQYTRLGNEFSGLGLGKAMTHEGYIETINAGAVRLTEGAVPHSEAIFSNLIESNPAVATGGLFSLAVAGTAKMMLRAGRLSRNVASKMMVPYASSDQILRSWSYWWQKMHTDKYLKLYEAEKLTWEAFEKKGLPAFYRPIRQEFRKIYDYEGKEAALQYIGKMGADEANFIYGVGAQPMWAQSMWGRLAGMFGHWPIWAGELYFARARSLSLPDQAIFHARTAALVGAFANMTLQSGISMWNWIAPASLMGWAGGPAVGHLINFTKLVAAPMDQKAQAAQNLVRDIGRLSVPGQMFYVDVSRALDASNPEDAALALFLGKPINEDAFSVMQIYAPDASARIDARAKAQAQSFEAFDVPQIDYRALLQNPLGVEPTPQSLEVRSSGTMLDELARLVDR